MANVAISYKSVMRMNKNEVGAFIRRNRKYAKKKKRYNTTGKSKKQLVVMVNDLWGNM